MSKLKLNKDEQEELYKSVELLDNRYAWENYCNSCDNFNTDDCPFRNKVNDNTYWKDINCKSYYS